MVVSKAGQDDLFGSQSVHELVEAHAGRDLLRVAANHIREPGRNSPLDILAGRRGSRTIKSAAARAEKAAGVLLGEDVHSDDLRSYAYAAWAHAGLPRRDLKNPRQRWSVQTDYATLTVSPGVRRLTDGSEPIPIGVPFGAYARLVLLDWQSEAMRHHSRQVHMQVPVGRPKAHGAAAWQRGHEDVQGTDREADNLHNFIRVGRSRRPRPVPQPAGGRSGRILLRPREQAIH